MSNYIDNLLIKYNHPKPSKPQHSPHARQEIVYGANQQLVPEPDNSALLNVAGIKQVQGIIGSLLSFRCGAAIFNASSIFFDFALKITLQALRLRFRPKQQIDAAQKSTLD